MSLLTTVKSATRAVNDELLGFKPFEKPRVIPHRRRVCYRPQQGSDAQSYSNFGDDPFYDIEGKSDTMTYLYVWEPVRS